MKTFIYTSKYRPYWAVDLCAPKLRQIRKEHWDCKCCPHGSDALAFSFCTFESCFKASVETQKIKKPLEWGPPDFISVFRKVVGTVNICTKQLCNWVIIYLCQAQVRMSPARQQLLNCAQGMDYIARPIVQFKINMP